MKDSVRMTSVGLFGILFFLSGAASASLYYGENEILDSSKNLLWKNFESVDLGVSQGYRIATVSQVAELFLSYAPPNSEGKLPGYTPDVGGVSDYIVSEDGREFSVSWWSSYEWENSLPPSLVNALGPSVEFGDGMFAPDTDALLTLVSDDTGYVPVLLRSAYSADQYGSMWGKEEGVIGVDASYFQSSDFFDVYCRYSALGCSWGLGSPYVADDGGLITHGFLMVSSVPEPNKAALFLFGSALLVASGSMRRGAGSGSFKRI